MHHFSCIPLFDPGTCSFIQTFWRGLFQDQVMFSDSWDDGFRVGALSEDVAVASG